MTPPGRVVLGVLLAGLPVAALGGGPRIPAEPADWAQDAYVWQRVWSPALAASLRTHAARFQRIDVLAAELDFSSAVPKRIAPQVDWPLLRGLPEQANLLYRSLVVRCPHTDLGRAAPAAHWFGAAD